MSTMTAVIGGITVSVKGTGGQNFQKVGAIDIRSTQTLIVEDPSGIYNFTSRMPVTITDSVAGNTYVGFVQSSRPNKLSPGGVLIEHLVTCMDLQALADKRTNSTNYFNRLSGDIAADFVRRDLVNEGVVPNFAMQVVESQSDWAQGNLSGTAATATGLQLAEAGSDLMITETNFSTGTLTNVQVVGGVLQPTTVSAICLQSPITILYASNYVYVTIWTGSMTVGTLDTLHYDLWIASTSPQQMAAVDLTFSDGTTLHGTTGPTDQNNLSPAPTTDLSSYAKNQWYSRAVSLGSGLNGKTIIAVSVAFAGSSAGTYTAYFKNIYLQSQSGSPFFSTSATTTQVNPPIVTNSLGFVVTQTSATVVKTFDPANNSRVSPAYNIDAVKLLRSSVLTVNGTNPGQSTTSLSASYDGGSSYFLCTNNSALPMLPAGSNVVGLSVTFKESFGTTGSDPTLLPVLSSVNATLQSAASATKSDIVTTFASQSAWNTGTYTNTQALANGDLTLNTYTRDWNDNTISNQTFFVIIGSDTQSASSGAYAITLSAPASGATNAASRLDFVPPVVDFTIDVDVKFSGSSAVYTGVSYRQTTWNTTFNTEAYIVYLGAGQVTFGYGSNGTSGSFTTIQTVTRTFSVNTFIHLKIVVSGSLHQIFVANETTPVITATDTTYNQPGNIGLYGFNNDTTSSRVCTWDNFVVNPSGTGTWQGPATSISSLGTCGPSVIAWTSVNTANSTVSAATVSTSVDGGSTFQTVTSGAAIPNLPSGTNVSGKSVIVKISFQSVSQALLPIIRQLAFRVLGAYPGSTGTRTTVPLGIDTMVRSNSSGSWGTGYDGQTYTKNGTGTIAISSNEGQITNTTGDVDMVYGSHTGTDLDATDRFSLSVSGATAMIKLRYVDSNNYYALAASTTTVSIIKKSGGVALTLASISMVLATGTYYRMRFRVVGTTQLYGNIWADGVLENTIDPTTYEWNNNNWTITASE